MSLGASVSWVYEKEFYPPMFYPGHMGRIEERKKEKQKGGDGEDSDLWSYVALIAIVGIIGLIAYFLFFTGGAAVEVETWGDVRAVEGQDPTMVAANASDEEVDDMVEVVYYGDYACPFCKQFEGRNLPRLKDEYIATGDVKFIFRPVDNVDQNSRTVALASMDVWEQNITSFWEWHKTAFVHQGQGRNWGSPSEIEDWTSNIEGLDAESVRQASESGEYAEGLASHRSQYREVGARGTPNLYINGSVVNPESDYERVQELIEAELEQN